MIFLISKIKIIPKQYRVDLNEKNPRVKKKQKFRRLALSGMCSSTNHHSSIKRRHRSVILPFEMSVIQEQLRLGGRSRRVSRGQEFQKSGHRLLRKRISPPVPFEGVIRPSAAHSFVRPNKTTRNIRRNQKNEKKKRRMSTERRIGLSEVHRRK